MDLVKGVPITKYCDEHHFTPRQRLELFIPVCQAIQHAHQKGIIHRDLKPSNVVVALYDGKPVPKVIDFGVAKAAGQTLTDKTLVTGFGAIIGTLEYMSPEQAEINQLDIDTRSDIYSLGVLLYELLTGSPPFTKKDLEKAGMLEMLRVIREKEPTKPSTKLSTAEGLPTLAANRGTEPGKLTKLLRGELDWIVMKALEKDRNRRYQTANTFAMDVQRYLNDEPVQACPPSPGYRIRKFVRRNKGRVAAAGALSLSLFAGLTALLVVRAQVERDRAAREAGTAASVAEAGREARERAEEAWNLHDDPDRMQLATDKALAGIHRGDGFVAGGSPTEATVADLADARRIVDELARHTRLIVECEANRQRYADYFYGGNVGKPVTGLRDALREALRRFGLDPINGPADEVARAVANSRIRDTLLGLLLEWHFHLGDVAVALPKDPKRSDPGAPVDRAPLARVIRSARQLCGGAYARWQELQDSNDVPGLVAFAASPDGLSFRSTLVGALGRDLRRTGQHEACRGFLRAAVDRYPYDVWLHYDLFQACLTVRPPDHGEALRHISAACALRPGSAPFQVHLGWVYQMLGSREQAIAAYHKAIALSPDYQVAYQSLAPALEFKKDWNGVIAARRELVRLSAGGESAVQATPELGGRTHGCRPARGGDPRSARGHPHQARRMVRPRATRHPFAHGRTERRGPRAHARDTAALPGLG